MKKGIVLTLLMILFSGCFCIANAAKSKSVSVYAEGDISKFQNQLITTSVMARISGNKDYVVYERNDSFISALNQEHDYQVSGEVADNQIRKIGQRYGVDFVIVLYVTFDDESTYMSARLINLESGAILKSVSLNRKGMSNDVLKKMANNITYRLINNQSK